MVFVPARCQWTWMSSAQLNDDVIMDIALSLSILGMVRTFSMSFFFFSFLTSCTPSLVAGVAVWSSNDMTVCMGAIGGEWDHNNVISSLSSGTV